MLTSNFVLPGDVISSELGYLRGHGTYIEISSDNNPQLIASVVGDIERIDKLISVKSVKSRYTGEVGDLLIGRIVSVEAKRWKVDINGHKDAILQLSSVNLPGGAQRIRTYEDQLQMRTLFTENDLISAEIQNIASDGVVSIHSRSLRYGKLENGQLIIVNSSLIPRLPQHYINLPFGIDMLLGKNGFIWITRSMPEEWKTPGDIDESTQLAESIQALKKRHAETPLLSEERLNISRSKFNDDNARINNNDMYKE
eukprot:gene17688-23278_t